MSTSPRQTLHAALRSSLPEWFDEKTSGLVDRMLCCSYMGDQVEFAEEYDIDANSILFTGAFDEDFERDYSPATSPQRKGTLPSSVTLGVGDFLPRTRQAKKNIRPSPLKDQYVFLAAKQRFEQEKYAIFSRGGTFDMDMTFDSAEKVLTDAVPGVPEAVITRDETVSLCQTATTASMNTWHTSATDMSDDERSRGSFMSGAGIILREQAASASPPPSPSRFMSMEILVPPQSEQASISSADSSTSPSGCNNTKSGRKTSRRIIKRKATKCPPSPPRGMDSDRDAPPPPPPLPRVLGSLDNAMNSATVRRRSSFHRALLSVPHLMDSSEELRC